MVNHVNYFIHLNFSDLFFFQSKYLKFQLIYSLSFKLFSIKRINDRFMNHCLLINVFILILHYYFMYFFQK